MPSEPRWLTLEEIVWINEQEVAATDEPHRLSDRALLESAIERPRNRWWLGEVRDLVRLAATFLFGIVKNHAFEQGNKRTGAVAALMLLEANGYEWVLPDNGELAEWVLAVVNDEISEERLAELMRPHVRRVD
ncbi:MAG: type II toxin-antitoxin system death-on-curing family toxin [Minwuiales bacterium]|nr:type II toxin-antitoxin system death-on-curing family toxin [Minwuiales bacterium]